ncbi:MAG: hypothetical protein LQ346_006827 [Caloplaca aetnensis]|nr:MAG: hypothetical protein LQ346_006827 [Caloplaca aetnensis]
MFVPERVEDGEVDGEGDGSDAYQPGGETPERWDVPAEMALMGVTVDDLTPTQIYAAANSPTSYYLRKEQPPEEKLRLIRHRGSILPFCEVVHIVHPHTAFHLAHAGSPPGVSDEAWERVKRAVSGEHDRGAKILASVLGKSLHGLEDGRSGNLVFWLLSGIDHEKDSPANLRAVPSNIAAFSTMMLRFQVTGKGPNYASCWARSTAWGYGAYQTAMEAQYEVVSASLGDAMEYISNDGD